jgi:hypothetical protein
MGVSHMSFRKSGSGGFVRPPLKRSGGEILSENKEFIAFTESLESKMAADYDSLRSEMDQPDEKVDTEEKPTEKISLAAQKPDAFKNFMKMHDKTTLGGDQVKRRHSSPHHVFKQENITKELDDKNPEHKKLINLNRKYGGLCEIISNFVIANDLLGRKEASTVDVKKFIFSNSPNILQMRIKLDGISEDKIKKSHIVETSNIFAKLASVIFNLNPHSIIPASKDILLNSKDSGREINRQLLEMQLDKLSVDDYIKFQVFRQKGLNFSGHSMVIKKTGEGVYSFFNPDEGEYQNLNYKDLCEKINDAIAKSKGDRVAFIDGKKYLADLGIEQHPANKRENNIIR